MWVPRNSWMVDFMENANLKWMMTGGTPILGSLHTPLSHIVNWSAYGLVLGGDCPLANWYFFK